MSSVLTNPSTRRAGARGLAGRSPFASLRENAALSGCACPPLRFGRTRHRNGCPSGRPFSTALYEKGRDENGKDRRF